jgi:hypothetical protein
VFSVVLVVEQRANILGRHDLIVDLPRLSDDTVDVFFTLALHRRAAQPSASASLTKSGIRRE